MQQSFVGPYELTERLAQGAFGAVFRAVDPEGREVALKLLQGSKGSALERFQREAQCLVRLRHPHVVGALDAGVDEGRPYLVLELVEGESLSRHVQRVGPLPLVEVVELGRKLASALAHVHEQGLVHRDVKPDNVLIDSAGEPRLTDFGLAHDLESVGSDRLTRSGVCLGTPGYWPPEQAAGALSGLGPEADVYALGATLWALLIGLQPFSAPSFAESVRRTLHDPPEPPSSRRPEVPPGLDAVILRCMAKDPARRYPSAVALEAALAGCLTARSGRTRLARGLLLGALLAASAAGAGLARGAWLLPAGRDPASGAPGSPVAPGPPVATSGAAAVATAAAFAAGGTGGAGRAPARSRDPDPELAAHRALLAAGDRPGALRALDALLARRPELLGARLDRGILQLQADDPAGARATLEAALALEPELAEALVWRGLCRARQGELEPATEDLERALALDPLLVDSHVRRLPLAFEPPLAARDELARMLDRSEPARASGWLLRGRLRALRGDPAGAEQDARRALDLGVSGEARAWALLGVALWDQRRFQEGYDAWTRALELDPACQQALHDRAQALRKAKKPREALADLHRLVGLAPEDAHYLHERAAALAATGEAEAALRDAERTLELSPGAVPALILRARLLGRLGEHERAAADLRRAHQLDPTDAEALFELIDELIALGRLDEAQAGVERLAALPGQKGKARLQRARARRCEDAPDLAWVESELTSLARSNPRHAMTWSELGFVRATLGRREPALEALGRAVELAPSEGYACVFLAALGGDPRALRAWLERPGWHRFLAAWLLGELSEEELFARAAEGDPTRVREQRCEAWCYAGMRAERAGDAPRARRCYEECLATGVRRFVEWLHARDRLRLMGQPDAK